MVGALPILDLHKPHPIHIYPHLIHIYRDLGALYIYPVEGLSIYRYSYRTRKG